MTPSSARLLKRCQDIWEMPAQGGDFVEGGIGFQVQCEADVSLGRVEVELLGGIEGHRG